MFHFLRDELFNETNEHLLSQQLNATDTTELHFIEELNYEKKWNVTRMDETVGNNPVDNFVG